MGVGGEAQRVCGSSLGQHSESQLVLFIFIALLSQILSCNYQHKEIVAQVFAFHLFDPEDSCFKLDRIRMAR